MSATVVVDDVGWPIDSAQVAIVEGSRVLLSLRLWPLGWELPGGHCEAGEDPALTAVREVGEETGLAVRIVGLVGVYTWAGLRSSGDVVYRATVGGGRTRRSMEAVSRRYVTPDRCPRTAFPWVAQRVVDAIANAQGTAPVHRVQPVTVAHVARFAAAWPLTLVDTLRAR